MKLRISTDLLTGLLFVVFGAFVLIYGWKYAPGTAARMGPGFFPRLASAALILVGALLVARSLFSKSEAVGEIDWRPPLAVLTGTLAFGVLIERAGLLICGLLLVVAARLADRDFRPVEVFLLAAVLIAAMWAIFIYGLGMRLTLLPPFLRLG
jgi:Tripartite tricarboxylate transporter TctB family